MFSVHHMTELLSGFSNPIWAWHASLLQKPSSWFFWWTWLWGTHFESKAMHYQVCIIYINVTRWNFMSLLELRVRSLHRPVEIWRCLCGLENESKIKVKLNFKHLPWIWKATVETELIRSYDQDYLNPFSPSHPASGYLRVPTLHSAEGGLIPLLKWPPLLGIPTTLKNPKYFRAFQILKTLHGFDCVKLKYHTKIALKLGNAM